MAITTTEVKITYQGNGTGDQFTFPYRFVEETDLEVYLDGELLVLAMDYTVTAILIDFSSGGIVTLSAPPAAGQEVCIIRAVPATQPTDYSLMDPFNPLVVEADLDRRAMVEQQLLAILGRALLFPPFENPPNRVLPSIDERAGEGLIFDVEGNIIAGSFYQGDPMSTWGKTLVDDADASEGRATLGVTLMDDLVIADTIAKAILALGVTVSTADPSGTPADGEIWLKREP